MAEKKPTNTQFAPEWDSEDTSGLEDDELTDQSAARDTETGAVIGVIGGAVVGAIAGGPVGAVVGGVLGGVAGGAGVAAVERYEHDDTDSTDSIETTSKADTPNPMSSPYPGDAGRPEVVQLNGVGIYDMPQSKVLSEPAPAMPDMETGVDDPRENVNPNGRVTFELSGYDDAEQVAVAGTFNNWSPITNLMHRDYGVWLADIALPPGKYQYKFVVDGRWIEDPVNPNSVDDGVGECNSVVVVERDVVNARTVLDNDYRTAS